MMQENKKIDNITGILIPQILDLEKFKKTLFQNK